MKLFISASLEIFASLMGSLSVQITPVDVLIRHKMKIFQKENNQPLESFQGLPDTGHF